MPVHMSKYIRVDPETHARFVELADGRPVGVVIARMLADYDCRNQLAELPMEVITNAE